MRRSIAEQRRLAGAQLPGLIDLVVVGMRAGLAPSTAVREAISASPAAINGALSSLVLRLDRGDALADALEAVPDWLGSAASNFTEALVSADRYGGPIGPMLDRLTDDVRAERRRRAAEQARKLPIKMSFPLVICTLPSFALLAIAPAALGAISTITS